MGSLFSSPEPGGTAPPEKINQLTPEGETQFGRVNPATGEFEQVFQEGTDIAIDPTTGKPLTTQKTIESQFAQDFRTGREDLLGGLLSQISGEGQTLQALGGNVPLTDTGAVPDFSTGHKGLGARSLKSGLQGVGGDFGVGREAVGQAAFDIERGRLDPQFAEEKNRLEQDLANRGIDLTSEFGKKELANLSQRQNDALTRASLGATLASGQEQSRIEGLNLGVRGQQFGENLGQFEAARAVQSDALQRQQQQFQNELAQRNLSAQQRAQQFGELGALGGFVSPFTPTPVTALSAGSTNPTAGGAGGAILGSVAGSFLGNPGLGAAAGKALF
jgi:hypothetical protein